MLQIKAIKKKYVTGDLVQMALDGVDLSFRDNEFVAILGPSGSGKTTLLNILGGLDRYDDGDLIINGVTTKAYSDRDWDSYRNHTIGFVFQNYNLIPHQTILANVELALTISGMSRTMRRELATGALDKVGLGDQLHKKPNQMSGGQMQRVAIARSLVNNPDILLADEPTGALDSATGIQVLELLKEVAKDRLVIMVTHNGELAAKYATRIVKLRDGLVTDDSNPFEPDVSESAPRHKNMGKASMSFFTSLALSFNNLLTKKGRTLLTAVAGSIGIIGIALILALSTGVNDYIASVQKDTMSSYPLTINAQSIDLESVMAARRSKAGTIFGNTPQEVENLTYIRADNSALEAGTLSISENDLTAFKKYLDDPNSEIRQYLGENGIVYTYDVRFDVYSKDPDGNLINTNTDPDAGSDERSSSSEGFGGMSSIFDTAASSGAENFEELMAGTGDAMVSKVVTDSYELLYGNWPAHFDEVVLVLDAKSEVPTTVLYQLGLITKSAYDTVAAQIENGEEPAALGLEYKDVIGHTFHLIPYCDYYVKNENGTFDDVSEDELYADKPLEDSTALKIVGVIRPVPDAANANIGAAVAYTKALTDYVIDDTNLSAVVLAQEATPKVSVLSGLDFEPPNDAAKILDAKTYIGSLNISAKATLYTLIKYKGLSNDANAAPQTDFPGGTGMQGGAMDEAKLAAAMDAWLANSPDETMLLSIYDEYVSPGSYDENMTDFGKVSYDAPTSISIYADGFEDKDAIAAAIVNYNITAGEDKQITYTDYVALLTSSITSIVNVISYVLIAFVAVSLVVSCLMIGIITHISVLERTKEIGILRAIGASKQNISQVFNAETFIIGLCAGVIGVGISYLLTIPINAVIKTLIGADTVTATLPVSYGLILIAISMVITVIGGLLPARAAAKKDPVVALKSE